MDDLHEILRFITFCVRRPIAHRLTYCIDFNQCVHQARWYWPIT